MEDITKTGAVASEGGTAELEGPIAACARPIVTGTAAAEGMDEGAVLALLLGLTQTVEDLKGEVRALKGAEDKASTPASTPVIEPLMTRQCVAAYLQCSLRFVDSLIADNVLQGVQIGSLKRFDRRAVEAMVSGSTSRRLRNTRSKSRAT